MSGTLFVVGTPIGNLGDITYRAVEVLTNADVIACEDTRHTLGLLNYLSVKKPLISYYKQKEKEGSVAICRLLEEGKNVALVSDAGMPCVSDPGACVVKEARENGFNVAVVPGPTAVTTAAALCGLPSGFVFVGFLPDKKKEFEKALSPFISSPLPLVFYTAPHDLSRTLLRLYDFFGARQYYAVKELTKIHESVLRGVLGEDDIEEPKGEFVLIVMPETKKETEPTEEEIVSALKERIDAGEDKKSAVKSVSEQFSVSKNTVYKLSLTL